MRANRFAASLLAVLALVVPMNLVRAGPVEDRASEIKKVLDDAHGDLSKKEQVQLFALLRALTPLQRFRVLEILDRSQSTNVRKIHDRLSDANKKELAALLKESGDAASAASLQKVGVISDVDDTAIPTDFNPDDSDHFEGARHFYDTLTREPIHYVSARPGAFLPQTKAHLEKSGMPVGTFDTRSNVWGILFGGEDDIEKSKVENIEKWLALHPGQRFVFLGDTLQRDAEVYRTIRERHPDQVAAIFIHEAGGPKRDRNAYPGATFFNTYPEAEAVWVAHENDPKPLAALTPSGTHPVEKTEGFLSSTGDFFKDTGSVIKKGILSGIKKIGIGD
ncbi:MAG: phosphatase domain-containing protein [Planctomycetota bacterium]